MAKLTIAVKYDVDMYQLYLAAVLALRNSGFEDQAYELLKRGQDTRNAHHLRKIVLEYVDLQFS